jgi:NAD(P) transhydrogenase subunit alpha
LYIKEELLKVIIVIPKEIFPGENRVACVPDVASKYIKAGFEVHVESNAGLNAGFTNEDKFM